MCQMGSKSSKKGKRSRSSKKFYEVEPEKKAVEVEPVEKIEEKVKDKIESIEDAEKVEAVEEIEEVKSVEAGDPKPEAKGKGFKPLQRMMGSKNSCISRLGNYLAYLWQYRTVVKTSVDKEFKGRF